MMGSAVSEPLPYFSADARAAFEQAAVQIEHVTGIRFAAGGALQERAKPGDKRRRAWRDHRK